MATNICPNCSEQLPVDAPAGVCPKCIIGMGLSSDEQLEPTQPSRNLEFTKSEIESKFPNLEVIELIGRGGMGCVYKVRQVSLDRIVALKIMPPLNSDDPSFTERFQREARALAKLSHPNIVMIFEFGAIEDMHFIIMEYVDGINLRQAIASKQSKPEDALAIIPQICEALQYAHDHEIVHRDIKPENILINKSGQIKIADFGLAKLVSKNKENFTLTGTHQVVGTPRYMAPEQFESPLSVDHRSDIYSLGVVFYEMLTGELPMGIFDPPSQRSYAHADVDSVVFRTLEKEPNRRFQQASEVKTAVQNLSNQSFVASAVAEKTMEPLVNRRPRTNRARRMPVLSAEVVHDFSGIVDCRGLVKLDLAGEKLMLELEARDFLGGLVRNKVTKTSVDFDNIAVLKLTRGWLTADIHLQSNSLSDFSEITGASGGKIQLRIAKNDYERAESMVAQVNNILDGIEEPEPYYPSRVDPTVAMQKPIVQNTVDGEHIASTQKRIHRVAKAQLIIAGITSMITFAFLVAAGNTHSDDAVGFFITAMFGFVSIAALTTSGVFGLKNKNPGIMKACTIVSMLPIQPTFLLTIPIGIWVLRTLKFPEVREVLSNPQYVSAAATPGTQQAQPTQAQPTQATPDQSISKRRYNLIGGALILFGGACAIVAAISGFAAIVIDDDALISFFMFGFGSFHLFNGIRIVKRKSRGSLLFGSIFAALPICVMFPITALVGLFGFITLWRSRNAEPVTPPVSYKNPYGTEF